MLITNSSVGNNYIIRELIYGKLIDPRLQPRHDLVMKSGVATWEINK